MSRHRITPPETAAILTWLKDNPEADVIQIGHRFGRGESGMREVMAQLVARGKVEEQDGRWYPLGKKPKKAPVAAQEDVPDSKEVELARAIVSLVEFVKQAWVFVDPKPLRWNWHMDIICNALQRQIDGDPLYRKLVIVVPPGSSKSLLASVLSNAWAWLRNPQRSKLVITNDDDLSARDNRRMRDLIGGEWYRSLVELMARANDRPVWGLAKDQNAVLSYANTARGFRHGLTIRGNILGKRGDDWLVDDPLDRDALERATPEGRQQMLAEVNDKIEGTLPGRVNEPEDARCTLIMQCLDEDDPAMRCLAQGWKHVVIQMEFDPDFPYNHPDDPRKVKGELMFKDYFTEEWLKERRKRMGERDYEAQYQQRPSPAVGNLFHREWLAYGPKREHIQRFHGDPQKQHFEEQLLSADCSFKDSHDADHCVIGIWGRNGARICLLDVVRERMNLPDLRKMLVYMTRKWPHVGPKLIEQAANGYAIVQDLHGEVPGLIGWEVAGQGSKYARAQRILHRFQAHDVWFPDEEYAPWLPAYCEELVKFKGSRRGQDDQVDMTSQALAYWLNQHSTEHAGDAYAGIAKQFDLGMFKDIPFSW